MHIELLTPHLEKVVLNSGFGRESSKPQFSEKILPAILEEFAHISGQKPATRPARKSIAGFKIREGAAVGAKATLRGRRMQQFLAKLIAIVLPRIRDFRGIDPKNIDKDGNLNIGIRDHHVFPEINPETSKAAFGIEITFVGRDFKDRADALERYRAAGVPFKKS